MPLWFWFVFTFIFGMLTGILPVYFAFARERDRANAFRSVLEQERLEAREALAHARRVKTSGISPRGYDY